MLTNAYLDAKIGFDPAENEPPKECCVVAAETGAEGRRSVRAKLTGLGTGPFGFAPVARFRHAFWGTE